jgi:hypothetical protein
VSVLAVRGADGRHGTVVMLGNLSRDAQDVPLRLPGAGAVRMRQLDQHTFERATMDPEGFLHGGEELAVRGGTATVTLNPYGVARLDIGHE